MLFRSSDETAAYVNFFKIRNGNIVQSFTTEIKKMLEETDEEILEEALIEIRQKFASESKEILLPFHLNIEIPNTKLIVPKVGDKKRIVELSEKNAKEYRLEKLKQVQIVDPERHTNRIMVYRDWETDRKSTRLNSSHSGESRMPSSA